ncbi:MAG: hypothetical protein AAF493_12570 [Pseudomonadota bacterium]
MGRPQLKEGIGYHVARGIIAQGIIARGIIAQGIIAQGIIAQGIIAQGIIERALSKDSYGEAQKQEIISAPRGTFLGPCEPGENETKSVRGRTFPLAARVGETPSLGEAGRSESGGHF